ncbi:MAG: hypothetical protein R3C03_13165 [Pirellulaceae bacterium]
MPSTNTAEWEMPDQRGILSAFADWSKSQQASPEIQTEINTLLIRSTPTNVEPAIQGIIEAIVRINPASQHVIEEIDQCLESVPDELPEQIVSFSSDAFVKQHVRLYAAYVWQQRNLHDEALAIIQDMSPNDTLQPHVMLFIRSICAHQLAQKDICLQSSAELLQNRDLLPARYVVLMEIFQRDIANLETDSIDEIARLMNDVTRRMSLKRSGEEVLAEEQLIVEKLDKLISRLEQQQQQSQPSAKQNMSPSTPMERSRNAGGKGSGAVTSRQLSEGGQWGDLPPGEKADSLAEMVRKLPPNYREMVEEYFRRLAQSGGGK